MTIRADRRVGLLLAGVILLAFVSFGASVALPATDESLDAKPVKLSNAEQHGMDVFRSEGCWYCHTTYLRNTATDGSGGRLAAPAFAGMSPSMLGNERIGADLLEGPPTSPEDVRRLHGGFTHLSDDDLEALMAYLQSRAALQQVLPR